MAAQIDSAADISVIPWGVVDELQLVQFGEQVVGGFGGYTLEMPTFLIRIGLRGQPLNPLKVLASREESFVLLGRDILNRFHLVLDGPSISCSMARTSFLKSPSSRLPLRQAVCGAQETWGRKRCQEPLIDDSGIEFPRDESQVISIAFASCC